MNDNKEPFFLFTLLQPLIIKQGYPISAVLKEIYDLNSYPYLIITDKKNVIFKMSQDNAPRGFRVSTVIFSLMYNKEFKA